MKKYNQIIACVLAMIMMLAVFTGCGGSASDSSSASSTEPNTPASSTAHESESVPSSDTQSTPAANTGSKSVSVGTMDLVTGQFTAGGTSNSPSSIGVESVFETLFEMDTKTGETVPKLVKDYEWEDDITLRITLKDGIYFSDGTQMTAEDVFFSLQRYVSSMIGSYYAAIDYDKSYILPDDPLTFYLIYSEPFGPGISMLDIHVMSKAWVEAHPDEGADEWFNAPVGSGPYEVAEVVNGSYIKLKLREDYWGGSDQFDVEEFIVRQYSDSTAMFVDFQNGVIDVILKLSSADVDALESGTVQDATLVVQPQNDVGLLCLNENNEYLQNPKVREAIAYALDMDAISKIGNGNLCTEATSHMSSTFSMYTHHDGYDYNPEYAKQCLDEAGYAPGDINLLFVSDSEVANVRAAEAIQGYLGDIGIGLEVQSLDMAATIQVYLTGGSDFFLFHVTGGNMQREPVQSFATLQVDAPFPCSRLTDDTFNSYINAGMSNIDEEVRAEAYQAADDWLYENFHALPVCEYLEAYAYNSRIESMSLQSTVRAKMLDIKLAK